MEKIISLSHGRCDAYVRHYVHLAPSRNVMKIVYPPFSSPVYELTFLQSFIRAVVNQTSLPAFSGGSGV